MWQKKKRKKRKKGKKDTTRFPFALGTGVAALASVTGRILKHRLPNISMVGKGPPS